MNKLLFGKHATKYNDLLNVAIALTVLSLTVSWAVELLALEVFRLG